MIKSKFRFSLTMMVMALGLLWATVAQAQTALPAPNAGFDITGFVQAATLNATPKGGVDPAMRGGTITVNGRGIIVPDNSIVQMPAAAFTWAQLFDPAVSAAVGNYIPARPAQVAGTIGFALNNSILTHFPSYEVRVVGNIVTDPATGVQNYIAGLIVPFAQQGLNGHGGYINFIDYDGSVLGIPGRFRVGGTMGDSTSGTLCELNDPVGRFGAEHSPDQRFQVDWNNPTVSTATGYPCGIPRVAPVLDVNGFPVPGQLGDPDRPFYNRPPNGGAFGTDNFLPVGAPMKIFTMPAAAAPNGPGVTTPDPWKQVPLMVGDWVDVSGTLFKIDPAGPANRANTFISVHTLTAHLGVKTQPGTNPAYVRVEGLLFGVGDRNGGPTVAGITQETSTRVALVAFTSNSNPAGTGLPTGSLFGIDANPTTGVEAELQFPNGNGANIVIDDPIRGRMRWQISNNGSTPGVLANAVGPRKFYREYILKLSSGQIQLPNQANGLPGLIAGQYRLPIFEFIFGEGTNFGEPWPPFNFEDFGFLTVGQGPTGPGGVTIGRLKPFPASQ